MATPMSRCAHATNRPSNWGVNPNSTYGRDCTAVRRIVQSATLHATAAYAEGSHLAGSEVLALLRAQVAVTSAVCEVADGKVLDLLRSSGVRSQVRLLQRGRHLPAQHDGPCFKHRSQSPAHFLCAGGCPEHRRWWLRSSRPHTGAGSVGRGAAGATFTALQGSLAQRGSTICNASQPVMLTNSAMVDSDRIGNDFLLHLLAGYCRAGCVKPQGRLRQKLLAPAGTCNSYAAATATTQPDRRCRRQGA